MKKLFAITTVALGLAFAGQAYAHGAKPKHGGIVQSAGDLAFELVSKDGKAVIYVDDHGHDLPTAGASGKLTVLAGAKKTEVDLVAGENNTLISTSEVKLAPGTKAIAAITFAGKEPISVRFSKK